MASGLNKMYVIYNSTLTTEQLGRAASKIAYELQRHMASGLNKMYVIYNSTLTIEQLGRAASKIAYTSTAQILRK